MPTRTFPKKFDVLDERWYECTLCGQLLYPESRLQERDGKRYCAQHFRFRFYKKDLDDYDVNAREIDE